EWRAGDRGRVRGGLRLRHLPRACRRSLARGGGRALADGGGHARLRLRRAAELAALLPDQGDGRTRRPDRAHARAAGVSSTTYADLACCAPVTGSAEEKG